MDVRQRGALASERRWCRSNDITAASALDSTTSNSPAGRGAS
jgi:hypothetical protein